MSRCHCQPGIGLGPRPVRPRRRTARRGCRTRRGRCGRDWKEGELRTEPIVMDGRM